MADSGTDEPMALGVGRVAKEEAGKAGQGQATRGPLRVSVWGGWHLGGSVVEHLPLAQVMILGSWDRVLLWAPCRGTCFSLCLSLLLCVSHE